MSNQNNVIAVDMSIKLYIMAVVIKVRNKIKCFTVALIAPSCSSQTDYKMTTVRYWYYRYESLLYSIFENKGSTYSNMLRSLSFRIVRYEI